MAKNKIKRPQRLKGQGSQLSKKQIRQARQDALSQLAVLPAPNLLAAYESELAHNMICRNSNSCTHPDIDKVRALMLVRMMEGDAALAELMYPNDAKDNATDNTTTPEPV